MTGKIEIPSIEDCRTCFKNLYIYKLEKPIWVSDTCEVQINSDIVEGLEYITENGNIQNTLYLLEKHYARLIVRLQDVPSDYQIGDFFKLNNKDITWIYAGENLGISKEYLGPYTLEAIHDTIKKQK